MLLCPLDCKRWRSLDCKRLWVCDALRDATWRESPSIRSRSPSVLLDAAGEMLAVIGWGVTSQIVSARCEATSRLPSVWPVSIACTCGGRRLAQMVRRKSSGTSGARLLRCRRNCDGFQSSISSCESSCLTRPLCDVDNRRTSSALSRSYGSCSGGEVMMSSTSAACCWLSCDTT